MNENNTKTKLQFEIQAAQTELDAKTRVYKKLKKQVKKEIISIREEAERIAEFSKGRLEQFQKHSAFVASFSQEHMTPTLVTTMERAKNYNDVFPEIAEKVYYACEAFNKHSLELMAEASIRHEAHLDDLARLDTKGEALYAKYNQIKQESREFVSKAEKRIEELQNQLSTAV